MTLGVGLNRVADFNTRYSYSSESVYDAASGQTVPTLADVFSQQLTYHGIFPSQDGRSAMTTYPTSGRRSWATTAS